MQCNKFQFIFLPYYYGSQLVSMVDVIAEVSYQNYK